MNPTDLSLIAMANGAGADGQPAEPAPQQSQQPEQPSDPGDDTGSTEESSGSSGGCFKWVVGCGCLTLFALVCGVGGPAVAMWQLPKSVGAEDWGELTELADTAKTAAQQQAGGGDPQEAGGIESMVEGDGDNQTNSETVDNFFERLDEPVSTRQLRGHIDELDEWEQSRKVREFEALVERAEELEDSDSVLDSLRAIRVLYNFVQSAQELGAAFAGRDESFHRTHSQTLAIVRLSQFAASSHDPWEQTVADAMLEDHDEHREEFEEVQGILERTADDDVDPEDLSQEEQQRLAEAQANQFMYLTSAINRTSLESWAALSDDERQNVVEHANAPHNIIARMVAITHFSEHEGDEMYYMTWFGL